MSADNSDQLYTSKHNSLEPFHFNQQVAAVFADMAERSIPGYRQLLDLLGYVVPSILKPDKSHVCYDLGCSLGAASYRLSQVCNDLAYQRLTIYAVDKSPAMIRSLEQSLADCPHTLATIKPVCADIEDYKLGSCSLILLNYTLQFIDYDKKQLILDAIYHALEPGGWLILSEKIISVDLPELDQWQQNFKKNMGYSDLEIAQKRQALENVMCTDNMDTHIRRLQDTGFTSIDCWHRALNFVSLAARK